MVLLIGMNQRLRHLNIITWASTILKFLCIVFLIKEYQLLAVVLGFLIPSILLPMIIWIYLKEFNMPVRIFLKEIFLLMITGFIPLTTLWIVNLWILTDNVFLLILKGTLWCGVYWTALYFIMLSKDNQRLLKEILRKFYAVFISISDFSISILSKTTQR